MKIRSVCLAAALLMSGSAFAAQNLVFNGSLTGPIENNGVPNGWTTFAGTPDVMDDQNNVGVPGLQSFAATPSATPDGGTWVGLGANIDYVERFGQWLSNLTIGQTYTVSWFAGNFGYAPNNPGDAYLGSNAINVLVNDVSIGQGATLSTGSSWYAQSLTFTATASSQLLSFQLASSEKAFLSIDGIAVYAGTPAVPEPATWALMMMGLAAVGAASARRAALARQ